MAKITPQTCVRPGGTFIFGLHKPAYTVTNQRQQDFIASLGRFPDDSPHTNHINFPEGDVEENAADWIYEIPNPFPFRGTTYICKTWAEKRTEHPEQIALPDPIPTSFSEVLKKWQRWEDGTDAIQHFRDLPQPVLLALAANSTDERDLVCLARLCCDILFNGETPDGLRYQKGVDGRISAQITNHELFEVVVNNPHLPDSYKEAMVLRPGVQGASEIVGEWQCNNSHIFEYLRRNSYIPWGHYAANMAPDARRYHIRDLQPQDMDGLRHLYCQRTYLRLAALLHIAAPDKRQTLSENELESLRQRIRDKLAATDQLLPFSATLWGWNYGFDCAASGYRMHASHQMVHQQYAMVPESIPAVQSASAPESGASFKPYSSGDLIAAFIADYAEQTHSCFFDDYLQAIQENQRLDGRRDLESSLVVHQDEHVLLFVPKAQTSQWELQLMTRQPVGNIVEANTATRKSISAAMLTAMRILTSLGARMISTIEFSKRLQNSDPSQRLLYSFLPKLPHSPGAFSEAQLRWINGHYPEDFARACRMQLKTEFTV